MSSQSRRRVRPVVEVLETRLNPSTPTLVQSITLPGASSPWNYSVKGPFSASPVVADIFHNGREDIVLPGGDGNVYAYGLNNAGTAYQELVQYNTGPTGAGVPIQSTPIVVNLPSGPAVFVANVHGIVYGWNAQTGQILPGWPASVAAPDETPTPGDTTYDGVFGAIAAGDLENNGNPDIVVPSFNNRVTAFHSNGTVFWRFDNDDTVFSGIAIGDLNHDGRLEVVVGGDSSPSHYDWAGGRINCLSWEGKREWVVQTNQVIWSSPVLVDLKNDGNLDVVVGTGFFYGSQGNYPGNTVYAVDAQGHIVPGWPFVTAPTSQDGRVLSSPAVGDLLGNGQQDIVFDDFSGNLYAVAPNGQQIWKTAAYPGEQLFASPIIGPDTNGDGHPDIFLGTSNGAPAGVTLSEFDGVTGTLIFTFPGPNPTTPVYPMFNAVAVGHFGGNATYQMAVSFNNFANGQLLSPSFLDIFNMGTSTVAPPWGQYRGEASGEAVARSSAFSTAFITNLYQGALGRTPSSAELNNTWLPLFTTAPSLEPLIQDIVGSTEARSDRIKGWYQTYLNRPPEPTGLTTWLNYLAAGNTWATAQANIAGSLEAFHDAGGTNTAWVTYLYQKILGRNPSQSELNLWVPPLNAGQITRPQVVLGFLLSPEKTNALVDAFYATYRPGGLAAPPADDLEAMGWDLRTGHREEGALVNLLTANGDYVSVQPQGAWVRALYQDVLHRGAAPSETALWLTNLEHGMAMSSVAAIIVTSSEANAQLVSTPQYPPGTARVGDLQGYYQRFLNRTPASSEEAIWLNALNHGTSRTSVVYAIVTSDEYFALAGGTNAGFITKLYTDLYDRTPTSGEVSFWLGVADVRHVLPQTALGSTEYLESEINGWYNAYLHRFPNSPADVGRIIFNPTPYLAQNFVDALASGASPAAVQIAILTSAEYQNVALYKEFFNGARWLN
jgi:hypothetical protein